MHFEPGAIPHVDDTEGRKAFKKAVVKNIKEMGGSPKESQGLASLRNMRAALKKKAKAKIEPEAKRWARSGSNKKR